MKIVTWNIQWGRGVDGRVDLARVAKAARALADFDVLCVQEVADNFPELEANDAANQFAALAALLPGFTPLEGPGVDRAGGSRRKRFGNMIFTRLPVLWVRRHALPWPADPGVATMPRVAIEAALATPFGPVRVTTTHLEYYSGVQRMAQARRLRELHEESCARALAPGRDEDDPGPFDAVAQTADALLTGDFNFPPEAPEFAEIQAECAGGAPRYRDAWSLAHPGKPHPPTFCVYDRSWRDEPYCCDFIFVAGALAVHSIEVIHAAKESDHQPVVAEIGRP
jgi:endonuclease/exonuclease/phosphatase family metal-dependent hydrolase